MLLGQHAKGQSQGDIIDRIKASRETEPVEPTETSEAEESGEPQSEEVEQELTEETDAGGAEELEDVDYEEVSESEEGEEPRYSVGDVEVTLSELKELKESGLRRSDYTKKTMALAEERKAYEAERESAEALKTRLSSVVNELESHVKSELESVDWDELAEDDPSEFLKRKNALEKKQKALEKADVERTQLLQQRAAKEVEQLTAKMPEWASEKGESLRKADTEIAMKQAAELGFKSDELNSIVDHRFYLMLIKAAKYDQLAVAKGEATKKVKRAPKVTPAKKVVKQKLSEIEAARKRYRQTGKDRDAQAAIRAYLGG